MPSTYSNLKIQLMATGENTTTWGDVTNINLGTAIEEAIVGSADVTFASNNVTLTLSNTNTTQTARNLRLRCTGTTGGSTRNLVVPSIEKQYIVQNDCADSVVVKTAAGTGITVPAGKTMWVYSDATNVVDVVNYLTALTTPNVTATSLNATNLTSSNASITGGSLSGVNLTSSNVTITGGSVSGTNLSSANVAFTGGSISGVNLTSSNVTVTGGSVSGVNVSLSNIISSNITSSNITLSNVSSANVTITGGSISGVNFSSANATITGGSITGITDLAIADGGTGASTAANARTNLGATTIGANLFTLTNPSAITFPRFNADNTVSALDAATFRTAAGAGTVTSVDASGGTTGLTVSGGPITASGTLTLAGTLVVANGGTGATTASGARTNLGATTIGASMFTLTNPGAITFPRFNADNTVSALTATDFRTATGSGTVTSVNASGGTTGLSFSGGAITTSGTLTLGGTLAVASGGTGATTASDARTNLSAQETLVSGTNIKTINGTSLLGSGNIDTTTGVVPAGVIVLWSGSSASIPAGWVLCNGLNSTPDLRDRFIVGAGSTYAVGATGGSADAIVVSHTHTASVSDPGHNHTATVTDPGHNHTASVTDTGHTHTASVSDPGHFHNLPGNTSSGGINQTQIGVSNTTVNATSASATTGISVTNASATTGISVSIANKVTGVTVSIANKVTGISVSNSTTGSSGTNANLPPYYALCYIMKT